jgi:hypothetical protein
MTWTGSFSWASASSSAKWAEQENAIHGFEGGLKGVTQAKSISIFF